MAEEQKLAELTHSTLDNLTLQRLLEDLTSLTEILEVTTKGGEFCRAKRSPQTLGLAVEALQAGQIRGVQIRYRWQQEEWLDTLLAGPAGLRIVRVKVEF